MTDTYYKVLGVDGKPCHGGTGVWKLPRGKHPGAWMPKIDHPVLCARGYHLCRRGDLVRWLGPTIYGAEVAPDAIIFASDDKVVTSGPVRLVRQMTRWNDRTARLFAADCAERALPIFERAYPGDDRPRKAIAAARAYARGEIDSAALDAAVIAARSAAVSAAVSAVWSAALSAARRASWRAADSAAQSAAESAARSAALSAAESAAVSAAQSAAESAAVSAAVSAALSAARAWQTDRLFAYLAGEVGDD